MVCNWISCSQHLKWVSDDGRHEAWNKLGHKDRGVSAENSHRDGRSLPPSVAHKGAPVLMISHSRQT